MDDATRKAFDSWMDTVVDHDMMGNPIKRREGMIFSARHFSQLAWEVAFVAGLRQGASDGFNAGYAITNERWNAEHYPDDPQHDYDFGLQRDAAVEMIAKGESNAK